MKEKAASPASPLFAFLRSWKSSNENEWKVEPSCPNRWTVTSRPGSDTPGSGRSNSALARPNTVVVAPMPTAMVSPETAAKSGECRNPRSA